MSVERRAGAEADSAGAKTPAYTMYLDQSAHLDWDWIETFDDYYTRAYNGVGVRGVLTQALANLEDATRGYGYSICEMGFLQRFVEEDTSRGKAILEAGERFQVLGGGITSPDCLVCSGEGFIRNYLVGREWLAQGLPGLEAKPYCLIPDDFGQGPELPVLLQALGFTGVAYSRLPGTSGPYAEEPKKSLLEQGVDFVWRASDGSQVVAHWMLSPNGTVGYAYAEPEAGEMRPIADLLSLYQNGKPKGSYPAAGKSTFMYFPVENDFSMPVQDLPATVADWNQSQAQEYDVCVKVGTFDDFMQELLPLKDELPLLSPYNGTPYWTGYYASRPELKILHYEVLRTLLAAEVFGLLALDELPKSFWGEIADAWAVFAPSTHHDYVCGTANDAVYEGEQLPRLQEASNGARARRDAALAALAGTVAPVSKTPVVVANGLGFARTDLAELSKEAAGEEPSSPAEAIGVVQRSFEGGTLFIASVPSLGFQGMDLGSAVQGTQMAPASITPESSGATSYLLSNEFMRVTISDGANWGIQSLVDAATGDCVLKGQGNELAFYSDAGGIYQFGNESFEEFTDTGVSPTLSGPVEVLEAGPLRVRLRTRVTVKTEDADLGTFTREYALVAGEPFLRMITTGAAPSGYSVMARFPFAAPVASISHGTACHWTDVQPRTGADVGYWDPPVFRPTHDFLLPKDAHGDTLAAMYHAGMPAWASDGKGMLIGCLLRNTPGNARGAWGTDSAQHTQLYALRVPSGLAAPQTGQPLMEARRYNTPLQVAAVPQGAGKASSGSLAAVSAPAIITAAKPGSFDPTSLVLRVYQPSNDIATVQVTLGSPSTDARVVNALEGDWEGPDMTLTPDDSGFSLRMPSALGTVQIAGSGRNTS